MAQKRLDCFFSKVETVSTEEVHSDKDSSSSYEDQQPAAAVTSANSSSASEQNPCECLCCTEIGIPYQPLNVFDSKTSHSHQSKERRERELKSYTRKIQPSWYQKYPWISVCTSGFKIFCSTCRNAKQHGLITFTKHQKTTFVDEGFRNWRKALQRFQEHEKSMMHKEAIMKIAAKSNSMGVAAQLSTAHATLQKFHREMLMKLLSSIKFLARQGLAFRGHHEDVTSFEGNLNQLLLLRAEDYGSSQMKEWLLKKEYISPSIVNEIIMLMGQSVLREILEDIRGAIWFSLIVDEATDVSHNEQLSLSIRWVDIHYQIHEDTLGLIQLENTKAKTLFSVIKDLLIRCSLAIGQCRGQAYDRASNMSGIHSGVQALVKQEVDRALYVHCLAHSLNLCIQEVSKKCDLVRNVMEFIYDIVQLIKFSPKRLSLFDSLRKEISVQSGGELSTPSLRTLCPTHWTVRGASIDSVIQNYKLLLQALREVQQGHDEYAAKAYGLITKMESFDTYFGLKLASLVFSSAEQYSSNLQAKDITIQEAIRGADLLISRCKSLRKETTFNLFYDEVSKEASNLTEEPKLPRSRKMPKRYDDGVSPHQYRVPKDRYRHAYFEVLELVAGEVERRFDQSDFYIIKEIEKVLLNAANGELKDIPDAVMEFLKIDIDQDRFKVQLAMVSDLIRTAFKDSIPVKKVTNVRTIADAMEQSEIYKNMLSEVDKVLKIFFTFPVTSATAERSFSSLKRLKSFLRTTMTHCRLNNLFTLYINTD